MERDKKWTRAKLTLHSPADVTWATQRPFAPSYLGVKRHVRRVDGMIIHTYTHYLFYALNRLCAPSRILQVDHFLRLPLSRRGEFLYIFPMFSLHHLRVEDLRLSTSLLRFPIIVQTPLCFLERFCTCGLLTYSPDCHMASGEANFFERLHSSTFEQVPGTETTFVTAKRFKEGGDGLQLVVITYCLSFVPH